MYNKFAGILSEDVEGFHFIYDQEYLASANAEAISLTLPLTPEKYSSNILFPFFDGLIPEGWLLDIAVQTWKVEIRDRMTALQMTCKDCIGAVSIEIINESEDD